MDDLAQRMHSSVGPSRRDHADGLARHTGNRGLHRALHGHSTGLALPARERGPIILHDAAELGRHSTNSNTAMGAASPKRGPNLTIRVYPPGRPAIRGPISLNKGSTA